DFGDLAARLRDRGNKLCAFAADACSLSLKSGQTAHRNQFLIPKVGHASKLALNQLDLLSLGFLLRLQTRNFLLELNNTLLKLLFLSGTCRLPHGEQTMLAVHDLHDKGFGFAARECGRYPDIVKPIA